MMIAQIAYTSDCKTSGFRPASKSRTTPPPTPVNTAAAMAADNGKSSLIATCAPWKAKATSPIASTMTPQRSQCGKTTLGSRKMSKATRKQRINKSFCCQIKLTGLPSRTFRIAPPPNAVVNASSQTPKISYFSSIAMMAPLAANATVPTTLSNSHSMNIPGPFS